MQFFIEELKCNDKLPTNKPRLRHLYSYDIYNRGMNTSFNVTKSEFSKKSMGSRGIFSPDGASERLPKLAINTPIIESNSSRVKISSLSSRRV